MSTVARILRIPFIIAYGLAGLILCLLAKPFGLEERVSWWVFGL